MLDGDRAVGDLLVVLGGRLLGLLAGLRSGLAGDPFPFLGRVLVLEVALCLLVAGLAFQQLREHGTIDSGAAVTEFDGRRVQQCRRVDVRYLFGNGVRDVFLERASVDPQYQIAAITVEIREQTVDVLAGL